MVFMNAVQMQFHEPTLSQRPEIERAGRHDMFCVTNIETVFGIPNGPNSGLSVRLP